MTISLSTKLGLLGVGLALAAIAGCSSSSSTSGDAGTPSGTTDSGASTLDSGTGVSTGFGCSEGQDQCQCFDPPPSIAYSQATCTGTYTCCFTQTVGSAQECHCTDDSPCVLASDQTLAAKCP